MLAAGLVAAQELSAAGQVRRGVRVGGVDLSGLTRTAAADRLRAAAGSIQAAPLALQAGEATVRVARSKAGVELDVEASVAAAMEVGRGGPLDPARFTGWFARTDLPWKARVASARLERQLAVLDRRVGSEVREPTLRIGGRTLTPGATGPGAGGTNAPAGAVAVEPVAGRPGRTVDRAGAQAALLAAAAAPAGTAVRLPLGERPPSVAPAAAQAAADRAATLLEAPVEVTAGGGQADLRPADLAPLVRTRVAAGELRLALDAAGLDRLLRREARFAYTEPKDARFQPAGSGIRIVPGVAGLEVVPRKAAAAVLAAGTATDRSAALPTTVTQPDLTTKEAKALGVKEVMSTFTTTFSSADVPRVHNISLIAAAVHGSLVRPGQVFSMNAATGQRTAAKGYRTAHVIQNGEIVDGLGGGVCQAGTTMFNTAFVAGLPVTRAAQPQPPHQPLPHGPGRHPELARHRPQVPQRLPVRDLHHQQGHPIHADLHLLVDVQGVQGDLEHLGRQQLPRPADQVRGRPDPAQGQGGRGGGRVVRVRRHRLADRDQGRHRGPAGQLRLQLQPMGPGRAPRHRPQGRRQAGSGRPGLARVPGALASGRPGWAVVARWARLCLATSGPAPAAPW